MCIPDSGSFVCDLCSRWTGFVQMIQDRCTEYGEVKVGMPDRLFGNKGQEFQPKL